MTFFNPALDPLVARRSRSGVPIRVLISGGPGARCTSTGSAFGERLKIPVFDSDTYFHKPTDPPFQEPYSPDERRELLGAALATESSWILCGSVATWGLEGLVSTHGVFLQISRAERLRRLEHRQQAQFGPRIDPGGDMEAEHRSFLTWAEEYEDRVGSGRNSITDRTFLELNCERFLFLSKDEPFQEVVFRISDFLAEKNHR